MSFAVHSADEDFLTEFAKHYLPRASERFLPPAPDQSQNARTVAADDATKQTTL